MKLKRNCVFFNAKVNQNGRTPDWGQELGQGEGYLMKEVGCSKIINGLVQNIKPTVNFNYGNGGNNYDFEIVSVFNKINLKVYDSELETTTSHNINNPFILIIVKESQGVHIGRRTLKMNLGFSYGNIKNSDFYDAINNLITNPWFGYKLEYDNVDTGVLTLTIIKAPNSQPLASDPEVKYTDAKSRKLIWDKLADDYYQINRNFKNIKNKILFGAPGTGKSHKVDEFTKTAEEDGRVEKITFHPEFDYVSFVGGYKPSMEEEDIIYKFVPQAFTNIYVKAWNDLDNEYYLVIEEINRGNCAEIFGDIFQLLDRGNDYKVSTSEELKVYLDKVLNASVYIGSGKLQLPPNLNILATMNTSDQSLFPMDSAFKRRWDWEYIPINYESTYEGKDDVGNPLINESFNYVIVDNIEDKNKLFDWIKFIETVNEIIKHNENLGMDKCIGNFFVKPDDDNAITLDVFINKVIFYLWNDVFKDEENEKSIFPKNTFYEEFFPIKTKGIEKIDLVIKRVNEIAKRDNYKVISWKS